jgi:hypothetical protein
MSLAGARGVRALKRRGGVDRLLVASWALVLPFALAHPQRVNVLDGRFLVYFLSPFVNGGGACSV